jgi:uncharacterized membrane protein YraQ (UPF0718 family)
MRESDKRITHRNKTLKNAVIGLGKMDIQREESLSTDRFDLRCFYRHAILIAAGAAILGIFWFTSRYPALLRKASHVGMPVATMAFDKATFTVDGAATFGTQILYSALNWLAGMKIGMTFGVLFGALLHGVLRYFPLKLGKNLYLNSLKGAVVGVPMGVCANCAVPMACGLTRGNGRVEVALGYLFSSPNFNPVVVMMTFAALPWYFGGVKYLILAAVISLLVPMVISWIEKSNPMNVLTVGNDLIARVPNDRGECQEKFFDVLKELATAYAKDVWMLLKPTLVILILASLIAALALQLVPWTELLDHMTVGRAALVSLAAVAMPVPIALDVMFATELSRAGINPGYVMLFLMTLGTFSLVPAIYLWRDVSRTLAVVLFAFFWATGFVSALAFSGTP